MTAYGNRGRGWEAKLETQHIAYRRDALAVLFKAHPGTKVVNRKVVRVKGPPDYFGVIGDPGGTSGIPVMFDAKRAEGTRWSLGKLEHHQASALEAWQVSGGLAGIALWLNGHTFWVDWRLLGPLWKAHKARVKGSRASVDLAWLHAHAASMGGGADWLAVAL